MITAMTDTSTDAQPVYEYERVAAKLREQIASGALPPASLLPSEAQLSARYGVSRPTARAAIAALRKEGIVQVIKGKGSFVRRAADQRATHTHPRTITASGHEYRDSDTDDDRWSEVEAPSTYRVNATPALALAIGVAEHTPLFGCDRLLEDVARRRVLHRLYLPFPVVAEVPALEEDPFRPAGETYTLLADAGYKLAVTDYFTARNPNPDDAATLHIADGAPMLITRRITTGADGQPLAMEETHRSADDTQLAYTVALPRRR